MGRPKPTAFPGFLVGDAVTDVDEAEVKEIIKKEFSEVFEAVVVAEAAETLAIA